MPFGMARTLPGAAVAALAVALAAPALALGQVTPPPPPQTLPPDAAVLQYREAIPTGSGPVAPGGQGGRTAHTTPLAPAAERRLAARGGADGPILERVATSSSYGAPQQADPRGDEAGAGTPSQVGRGPDPGASPGRGLGAAAGTVAEDVGGRLFALLLGMLVVGAAVVVTARRESRASR
jgi:hypothetical protein